MKTYPSIPRRTNPINTLVHSFVKYDGSNLRFEWNKKQGWYKFGTRHRLFDKTDPVFGSAIKLFKTTIADDIESVLLTAWPGAQSFIVFCEYFGPQSFAGHHVEKDIKEFRLFDVNPYQQGLVGPKHFLELFGDKKYSAKYLGEYLLDQTYINSIRNSEDIYDGHYEGIICKWGEKHNLQMCKIKTAKYLNELKKQFGTEWTKYE